LPGANLNSENIEDHEMQFSTFTWIITAMLAGHALAMPHGGGNSGANNANSNGNGNGNSNGKLSFVYKNF
jgi:hypothetical protein